jgi:hypothetical protein
LRELLLSLQPPVLPALLFRQALSFALLPRFTPFRLFPNPNTCTRQGAALLLPYNINLKS